MARGLRLQLDMFHEGTGWFYSGKADPETHCPSRMDRSIRLEFGPLLPGARARRRILIATTQVPFVRGGAELHAEGLLEALRANDCDAEIAAIPFKWYPAERLLDAMLACRLLDLTEYSGTPVDLLIGLKFPAYLASGFGLWVGIQAFINIGVNMGVLPTKGLTLPLMSYGRSSLVVALAWIGLLLRVYHEASAKQRGSASVRGAL